MYSGDLVSPRDAESRCRALISWAGALLAVLFLLPIQAQASSRLLVLHSGYPGDPETTAIERGIEAVLATREIPPQYWVEHLDGLRFGGLRHEQLLVDLISRKYEGWRFDAIVTSGNYALEFVLAHRADLFGDTPVVFSAINGFEPSMLDKHTGVTGVSQANDFRTTLDLAFTLQRDTDEIVFVTPGLLNRHLVEPEVADYRPHIKMTFIIDEKLRGCATQPLQGIGARRRDPAGGTAVGTG